MALENKENLVSVVPSTKGKSTANDELIAQGNAILAAMSDEERSNLASKSGTLHFVRLLGLQSKKAERVIAGRQTITTFKRTVSDSFHLARDVNFDNTTTTTKCIFTNI